MYPFIKERPIPRQVNIILYKYSLISKSKKLLIIIDITIINKLIRTLYKIIYLISLKVFKNKQKLKIPKLK
jgi:hypothetical protein